MRRREFITVIGAAAACPLGARAQQHAKVYRIAIVHPSNPISELTETASNVGYPAVFRELRRLGYVEGRNLVVERYSGEGKVDRFPVLARDIVQTKPDLIFATSNGLIKSFKAATETIPILGWMADPVGDGIVASLARPGGNITGICPYPGLDIWGKRLEILREAVPTVSKVGFLTGAPAGPPGPYETVMSLLQEALRQAGIPLLKPAFEGPINETEYRRVFGTMAEAHVDGLIVGEYSPNFTYRRLIVDLVEQAHLPAIYPYREHFELGGLMAYAHSTRDLWGRFGGYIDQILKGANPSELAIYQGSKFELLLNLKTAKALGLTIPPTLLARADEVIE
jgi:putative ABC transport system substrate-binding protein